MLLVRCVDDVAMSCLSVRTNSKEEEKSIVSVLV